MANPWILARSIPLYSANPYSTGGISIVWIRKFCSPCILCTDVMYLLRLPVGRGGVINSADSVFFLGVEIWATAHG